MSADRLHERDLPRLLAELAPPSKPEYRDAIVGRTAAMRQRPAWTFAERWIPMTTYTSRATTPPAWRAAGVALLLVLALVLAGLVALFAGSRPSPTVAPFGPAANGLAAFSADGDIFTADTTTGVSTMLIGGDTADSRPIWSRDGKLLAFTRLVMGEGLFLFVAAADGTGIRQVAAPVAGESRYAFTPDGRGLLVVSDGTAFLAKLDGTPARPLLAGQTVKEATIRPGGSEILYIAEGGGGAGIYAAGLGGNADTARTIVAPSEGVHVDWLRPSPDGARIAYVTSTDGTSGNSYRVWVIGADGTGGLEIPLPAGAMFQDAPEWSNDGTRLVVTRGYAPTNEDMVLAIVAADGTGRGVESEHRITGCCDTTMEWAPDDSWILVLPQSAAGAPARQLFVDPVSGASRPAAWAATSPPTVQRVAR